MLFPFPVQWLRLKRASPLHLCHRASHERVTRERGPWLLVQGSLSHQRASPVRVCPGKSPVDGNSPLCSWTVDNVGDENGGQEPPFRGHHPPQSTRHSVGLWVLPGLPGRWGEGRYIGEKSRKACTHWYLGSAAIPQELRLQETSQHCLPLAGGSKQFR